ncbi:hypothetical protein B1757_02550 [Acidithiobacillus marinus]|uniref:Uncharacterized protein n=1 Tax=Acidithiobacillus marinus TaxID=187490 RepID=A0A2I1DPP8_9PROT|nr:thioredoxin fold domain-containing protein [Acidithiobacillus marinus]PKY11858.1 hypothetical protein B1757_02550 [Acidithiobacillus marinus]
MQTIQKWKHNPFFLVCAVLFGLIAIAEPAHASGGWHRFWKSLATTANIQIGTGPVVVYDFFDPNCPYCAEAFQRELPFIQSGKLTVRYIPVAILTPSSLGKAASILDSPRPGHALAVDFQGVLRDGSGGIRSMTPSAPVRAGIERNLQFLLQTGNDVVPDLVFRLPDGHGLADGHVGMIRGLFPASALQAIVQGRMP